MNSVLAAVTPPLSLLCTGLARFHSSAFPCPCPDTPVAVAFLPLCKEADARRNETNGFH
jgi:hypothetical protein